MKRIIFLLICGMMLGGSYTFAQLIDAERSQLRKGNRAFESGDYSSSEKAYRGVVGKNEYNPKGHYNLGNALYVMAPDSMETAASHFEKAANYSEDDQARARAYHNLGNAYLNHGKYQESVDAYKKALRLNSKDEDTRYNLAYALEKLRQQQQQEQNQDQNQDQDQDKDQDQDQENQDQQNQDQQDQEQNQDQQDQDQQDQEQENQQNQQQQEDQQQQNQKDSKQQQQVQQMSQEEIEQMLEALRYQEEKLQEKIQKKKVKGVKIKTEKDW